MLRILAASTRIIDATIIRVYPRRRGIDRNQQTIKLADCACGRIDDLFSNPECGVQIQIAAY
jgi:hypothetical protein